MLREYVQFLLKFLVRRGERSDENVLFLVRLELDVLRVHIKTRLWAGCVFCWLFRGLLSSYLLLRVCSIGLESRLLELLSRCLPIGQNQRDFNVVHRVVFD